MNFNLLIALIIVATVGCVMISYVFVRWVVPAIGRLRGRVLVQEGMEDKDIELEAPPSSDRNQMQT